MEILRGSYYHKDEQSRRTQTAGPLERFNMWNWIPALSECKRPSEKDSNKNSTEIAHRQLDHTHHPKHPLHAQECPCRPRQKRDYTTFRQSSPTAELKVQCVRLYALRRLLLHTQRAQRRLRPLQHDVDR